MPPEAPSDFAVGLHLSEKHGVIFMITKARARTDLTKRLSDVSERVPESEFPLVQGMGLERGRGCGIGIEI